MSEREPTEPFWLAVVCTTLNGDGIDVESREGVEGAFDTEAEAVACVKALLRDYGFQGFVYRCIPTAEITRRPNVKPLKTRNLLLPEDAS